MHVGYIRYESDSIVRYDYSGKFGNMTFEQLLKYSKMLMSVYAGISDADKAIAAMSHEMGEEMGRRLDEMCKKYRKD